VYYIYSFAIFLDSNDFRETQTLAERCTTCY